MKKKSGKRLILPVLILGMTSLLGCATVTVPRKDTISQITLPGNYKIISPLIVPATEADVPIGKVVYFDTSSNEIVLGAPACEREELLGSDYVSKSVGTAAEQKNVQDTFQQAFQTNILGIIQSNNNFKSIKNVTVSMSGGKMYSLSAATILNRVNERSAGCEKVMESYFKDLSNDKDNRMKEIVVVGALLQADLNIKVDFNESNGNTLDANSKGNILGDLLGKLGSVGLNQQGNDVAIGNNTISAKGVIYAGVVSGEPLIESIDPKGEVSGNAIETVTNRYTHKNIFTLTAQ